ncbi:MAG TPA: TetR-like C-terminal domain-containing protein [Nitrolancea sp.]|nr:TetR-like C-terminal domain-containing protein [Nitrolancea sp.]
MPRERLNRAAVIVAASRLLDSENGSELRLSELAAELGVRTPSLYNHVAGIDDLQAGVALYGTEELGKRIARAAVGRSGYAALWAVACAYRQFARERPGLYQVTLRAPASSEPARVAVSDDIIDVLKAVLDPLGFSEDRAVHLIRGLRSLLHGFVALELAGGFGMPLDVDESFCQIFGIFLAGLQHGAVE